jgi:hypothetical protein
MRYCSISDALLHRLRFIAPKPVQPDVLVLSGRQALARMDAGGIAHGSVQRLPRRGSKGPSPWKKKPRGIRWSMSADVSEPALGEEGMAAPARGHKATTRAGGVEQVAGCNPEKKQNGWGGIRAQRGTEPTPPPHQALRIKTCPSGRSRASNIPATMDALGTAGMPQSGVQGAQPLE